MKAVPKSYFLHCFILLVKPSSITVTWVRGEGCTSLYGLDRYMPPSRLWLLRVLNLTQGIRGFDFCPHSSLSLVIRSTPLRVYTAIQSVSDAGYLSRKNCRLLELYAEKQKNKTNKQCVGTATENDLFLNLRFQY